MNGEEHLILTSLIINVPSTLPNKVILTIAVDTHRITSKAYSIAYKKLSNVTTYGRQSNIHLIIIANYNDTTQCTTTHHCISSIQYEWFNS